MLTNKWFVATVAVLLAGAIAYNVWFFTREEGPGPAPAGAAAAGEAAGPSAARPDGPGARGPALFASLAEGRPPLRAEADLTAVEEWRARRPAWGRDPLSRTGAPVERGGADSDRPAPPAWRVTAIVRGQERRTAVIDGRAYSEGERIDGGTIEEIRTDEVLIRWRGRLIRVPLRER